MAGPFDQNVPWPTRDNNVGALLYPFAGTADAMLPDVVWKQTLVNEPVPVLPFKKDNSIGFFTRWYTANWVNQAANAEVDFPVQVDIPCSLFEITGAACDTAGAALPVGMDARDTFLVRFEHSQNDRLSTAAGLGSAMVGTAGFPAKVGFGTWKFGNGATMHVFVTPLRANLRITINLRVIEIRAGQNFGNLG